MKHIYVFLIALFIGSIGFAQSVIAYQGFEQNISDSWATTFSTPACTSGSDRWDYSTELNNINPSAGSQFWGITDLNGNCGSSSGESITFSDISVSNYTSISIKFDYEIIGFDNGDDLYYTIILDGISQSEIKLVDGSSNYSTNGYLTQTLNIPDGTNSVGLEIRVTQNGGDYAGLDNFILEGIASPTCTAPITQASAYNTTALGTTSATLNWTDGDGDEVLVVVKEGSAVDEDPTSGTAYTGNTTFTSGNQIGTGNYVVHAGSATSSVSITGLSEATTYHVAVYEYNTTDTCYLTPALTGSFTTGCSTPSEVNSFTATAGNEEVDLTWTNGSCYDEIVVIAKETSAVTVTPTGDGTAYTADAAFGSGTDLGTGEHVVYKGTGTSATVTGLTNGNTYHFSVFTRKAAFWSTGITANAVPNLTYCTPAPTSVDGSGITNVTIGTINNTTGEEVGNYYDYSAQSTNVTQGQLVNFNITYETGWTYVTKIWVDYNNDGDFEDTDEEVYSGESLANNPTTLSGSFTIPVSASLGQHRLRIGGADTGPPTPCYTGSFASYEDYTINITPPSTDTLVQFASTSATVSEGISTYDLEFSIINEDASNATTFEVALTTGDASDIDNYSTQLVTFPANSSTNQTLTITVTDDDVIEPNETLTFSIQNVTGGNNASAGLIDTFDLTLTNNDLPPSKPLPYNEDFSDCGTAEWSPYDEAGNDEWLCSDGEYAINGYLGTDDTDWLISDFNVDFDLYSTVTIDITTRERYGDGTNTPGEFDLLYSNDYMGGDPTEATWTVLPFDPNNTSYGSSLSAASTTTVDASGISGKAYLAFKYDMTYGSGAEDWRIQEIDIYGTLNSISYTYDGTSWSPSNPNGAATASDDIVITSGNASISSDTAINSVTVYPGAALTVDASTTLTVTDAVALESSSTSYSSLILDGAISGTIEYERHVNGNAGLGDTNAIGDNDLVTPPLSGQTFGAFADANSNLLSNPGDATEKAFAIFDKTTGDYENYNTTANASTQLTAGTGYRAATSNTATLVFTGSAHTGDITMHIDHSGPSYQEWNLIGNPYPSYLDVDAFLNYEVDTGIKNIDLLGDTSGIYGYDGNAENGWDIINLANASGRLLTPGQGFLVGADAANVASYDLEFTTSMRTTGTSDDFIAGRDANTLTYLKLNASTASESYTTQFYFNAAATQGLDAGYDATIWGGTAPNFALFSHLIEDNNGLPMALQALDVTDLSNVTIPLGVNANQGEQLTFSINASTLPSTVNVYLEDNVANTSTLLNTTDYILSPNTALHGTGRFYLRVSNSTLSTIDHTLEHLSIYTHKTDKSIVVAGQLLAPTTATIYDVQGRLVVSTLLQSTERSQAIDVSALNTGIYVVKLHNASQNKTQKVIIR